MARSTFRRTPLQNDIDFDDLNGGFFRYTKFGGLCDNRNDAVIDQETFADCKNVFVDTNELLTSRPPFKFLDDEAYIVKKWVFGEYILQFHRVPIDADGNRVDSSADLEDISFLFILRCISHDTIDDTENGAYGALAWQIDASDLGWDNMPKIKPVQIEDKIYFWFAGVSFVCFNTAGRKSTEDESDDTLYPYFEDAMKYIYLPVFTLVINGIESELESLNYLSQTYRKRYIYSALSSVNFASLVGKYLSVGLNGPNTQNTSKHLYDMVANSVNFGKMLIYPKSEIGSSYYTTMVKTPNSNVYLRHIEGTSLIEVSFDGSYYRNLPAITDLIGKPMLSEDGLYVIAFTKTNLAKCRLVAQESTDFTDTSSILTWEYREYFADQPEDFTATDANGVFPTIDNCAWWVRHESGDTLHVQWLRGTEDVVGNDMTIYDIGSDRRVQKMAYQYITPTAENPDAGPFVALLPSIDDKVFIYLFRYESYNVVYKRKSSTYINDTIVVDEIQYTYSPVIASPDGIKSDIRFYGNTNTDNGFEAVLCIAYHAKYISADGSTIEKDFLCTLTLESNSSWLSTNIGDLKDEFTTFTEPYISAVSSFLDLSKNDKDKIYICAANSRYSSVINDESKDKANIISIFDAETQSFKKITTLYEEGVTDVTFIDTSLIPQNGKLYGFGGVVIDSSISSTYAYGVAFKINLSTGEKEEIKSMIPGNNASAVGESYTGGTKDVLYIYGGVEGAPAVASNLVYSYDIKNNTYTPQNQSGAFDFGAVGAIRRVNDANLFYYVSSEAEKTIYVAKNDDYIQKYTYAGEYTLHDKIWVYAPFDDSIYVFPSLDSDKKILRITFDGEDIANIDVVDMGIDMRFLRTMAAAGDSIFAFGVENSDIYRFTSPNSINIMSMITTELGNDANSFVLSPSSSDVILTDRYLWYVDELINLPNAKDYTDIPYRIIPLYVDDAGVYYNIDGTIWTSDISVDTDNQLEIDEVINGEYDEEGNLEIDFSDNIPDYYASFNDHFLSFTDIDNGYNLLEVTSTRRDEEQLTGHQQDFLFYLPINSEERFSEKITNLHNIADTTLGVFTETSIYYINSVQLDIGLSYSKPVKSKIPLGVREGDDVITALDGQVILFATKRGIASMTPQDFIASTERTLVYLSDAIQNRYEKFYNQSVKSASLIPNEFDTGYKCMIKICTYRYWLLFYRYMDNQILAYDTRYNAWWIWTTPYPIRELIVTNRLEALLQIDFNPVDNSQITLPANKFPFMGVRYLWTDDEVDLDADVSGAFPTLTYEYEANESYYDDVIEGALNGDSELIYDNKFAGSRRQLSYASPTIEWYITSQRLHFNALNNYKLIQAIYMTAKGVDNMTATLSTKAYRDAYHPESSIVFQTRINDLRTFLKRMNLMHTQFFQFMLSNDSNQETQRHLKLDSISIRYEVKGVIR